MEASEQAAPTEERRGQAPATPAAMRAYIVERLVGDTGEPERVLSAAQALAERTLGPFAAALNAMLAAKLAVEVAAVAVARTGEAKALAERDGVFLVAPGGGASDTATVLLDGDALALVVSAMFGGDPALPPVAIARDPSPIEREVAASVLGALAAALGEGGGLGLDLPPPPVRTAAEAAKWTPRDGPAARVTLRLKAGSNGGDITVFVLQRILLGRKGDNGAPSLPEEWSGHIGGELMRSTVKVEAVMPLGRSTLGAVAGFAVGQVLALDDGAVCAAKLFVRNKPLFTGEFGRLGESYTVRVREPFSEAREFMNSLLPSG